MYLFLCSPIEAAPDGLLDHGSNPAQDSFGPAHGQLVAHQAQLSKGPTGISHM